MGSCMYLYPKETRFDLQVLVNRVKTKHVWWFIKEMPEHQGCCGSWYSYPNERPKQPDDYQVQDPQRPENKSPYFELTPQYVAIALNWSDTTHNDARRFFNFILHHHRCHGHDHDAYRYSSNAEIRRWMKLFLPKY